MPKETRGRPKGQKNKVKQDKLITVSIRSLVTHATKGTPLLFRTRDQVKDFMMALSWNEKPIEIKVY